MVERYVYNAYGKATVYEEDWTNPSAPTTDGPLYCGYFLDAETSLYQVRNRYYDASLSRFVNRDPIGYNGGINLYVYCDNSPLTRVDPHGLVPDFPIIPDLPSHRDPEPRDPKEKRERKIATCKAWCDVRHAARVLLCQMALGLGGLIFPMPEGPSQCASDKLEDLCRDASEDLRISCHRVCEWWYS